MLWKKNDLVYYSSWRQLAEELKDEELLDLSQFTDNFHGSQDLMKLEATCSILLSNDLLAVDIKEKVNIQPKLCDVQTFAYYQYRHEKKKISSNLFQMNSFKVYVIPDEKWHQCLVAFICESVFSTRKFIKDSCRNCLTYSSLSHSLRLTAT